MNGTKSKPKSRKHHNSGAALKPAQKAYNTAWGHRHWTNRIMIVLMTIVMLFVGSSYGVATWYIQKHAKEPLLYGTTFIPRYARYFDLDPQETMTALLDEVGFKRFRLVSYWDDIEKTPGVYNFDELDWQFRLAENRGAKIDLSLGLRQPRWPECHMPAWAASQPKDIWYPQLKAFMGKVIERYKDSPALISYQVENEFFMTIFGKCSDFDRNRFVDEVNFVKSLDSTKPIIVTRSNNWGGVPLGEPTPDQFGVAVYKRVWDKTLTKRYFEYPYPSWFYSALAGSGEIISGKDMIIHELQMEPWLPDNGNYKMNELSSIPEQNKSMNGEILDERFDYARKTGIRTIDTWGGEWWYWRKVKAQDPSLWEVAQKHVQAANAGKHNKN
jgi:hypothetical protein